MLFKKGRRKKRSFNMAGLDAFDITIHVQRDIGRCFKITSPQLDIALQWLNSPNIQQISLNRKDKKELNCVCSDDLESASEDYVEASIHCKTGKCLSVPVSTDTVRPILSEFIERPEVCKIEIWCKGIETSDLGACECLGWVEDGLRMIAQEKKK